MKRLQPLICLAPALLISLLAGCASHSSDAPRQYAVSNGPQLGNIELHTNELADELFSNFGRFQPALAGQARHMRIAVATFVPAGSLKHSDQQHPLMALGQQLEQGMITEVSRRGYMAKDYKVSRDIIIGEVADRVFTRDINSLSDQWPDIDLYLSGTIVHQQEGAIVNARLIQVSSKDVVASATRFFPASLFWQREQVTTRDGMIYRTGMESRGK